ncbi:hypothetical protein D3C71_2013700 [compost metagenome]
MVMPGSIQITHSFRSDPKHLRVFTGQPCRPRPAWRTQNERDAVERQFINDSVKPSEFELSFIRLQTGPGEHAHGHDIALG